MEGENDDVAGSGGGGGGATPATARWNPTKEQIAMLERLYREGIRTPSAEQIQQITGRLRAYGHIEGKNVFYWFQNHKARQRQKQKQENFAYFSRFLHNTTTTTTSSSPLYPPPPPHSVVCGPYNYIQQSHDHHCHHQLGFYQQQYPKVLIPGVTKRRPKPNKPDNKPIGGLGFDEPCDDQVVLNSMVHNGSTNNNSTTTTNHQTLPLFPLQPTGILRSRSTTSCSSSTATPSSSSETTNGVDHQQPFFDFFSGDGPNWESEY